MRIVVETRDFVAVGFDVPVAEFHDSTSLARHPSLTRLGTDVLDEAFDPAEAADRLREHRDLPIGDALLRQSLLAGIGNVYKSEICFACRVNPFRKVSSLSDEEVLCLTTRGREYLRANVTDASRHSIVTYTGFRRTTRRADPGSRLWVYGRNNQPCRRCGRAIQSRKQGEAARVTFWCPGCQPIASELNP
jgi:endonuclease-8